MTTGNCFADHDTVHAGITVDRGAALQLTNSTVDGGIVANNALDFDLNNSVINGGVSIAGPGSGIDNPTLCDLDIHGGVTLTNVTNYGAGGVGIGGDNIGIPCSGNRIDGSVTINNSAVADLFNTTINGSLLCINGGVVSNHAGDSITGSNSCF